MMSSRQKQSQRSVKGRLQSLPEMALEIQVEIYQYLTSCDLLHLSQTCKRFRAFFLNRSVANERLWTQARANTDDLPERPSFMSEPAFIHLLYSPYCHHRDCNSARTPIWHYQWFARYCHKCLMTESVSYKDAEKEIVKCLGKWAPPIETVLSIAHTEEYQKTHKEQRHGRVHKAHRDDLLKQWNHALCARQATLTQNASLQMQNNEKYKIARGLIEMMKAELAERRAYAEKCMIWHQTQQTHRIDEIIEHLKAKGWTKEVEALELDEKLKRELSYLPIVRRSLKLTAAECNRVCANKAVHKLLEQKRHERLTQERRQVLLKRFDALEEAICRHYVRLPRTASMEFRPRYIDFVFVDECRALLDTPTERSITAADFVGLIPDITATWEAMQREQLTEAIRQVLPFAVPKGIDVLELAVAFIPCPCGVSKDFPTHDAKDPLRFPAILGHDCPRQIRRTVPVSECDLYGSTAMYGGVEHEPEVVISGLRPFDVKNVPISKKAIGKACAVIEAMGCDPAQTTVSSLQGRDVMLTCRRCGEVDFPRFIGDVHLYTWDAAIRHVVATTTRRVPGHDKWKMAEHLTAVHLLTDVDGCVEDGTIYVHPYLRRQDMPPSAPPWHTLLPMVGKPFASQS
ncbi:hypothetical protein C8Q70DRAFT_243829 [Cubamyces menziesii]|nr:hypothetical protein C8Q70DRAFT_243829 [Cubamyces menziesii]